MLTDEQVDQVLKSLHAMASRYEKKSVSTQYGTYQRLEYKHKAAGFREAASILKRRANARPTTPSTMAGEKIEVRIKGKGAPFVRSYGHEECDLCEDGMLLPTKEELEDCDDAIGLYGRPCPNGCTGKRG